MFKHGLAVKLKENIMLVEHNSILRIYNCSDEHIRGGNTIKRKQVSVSL